MLARAETVSSKQVVAGTPIVAHVPVVLRTSCAERTKIAWGALGTVRKETV